MSIERSRKLVDSFVESMKESIRFFANDRISEKEIAFIAEREVNRLDFNNKWQMHKGIGFYARNAVNRYLSLQEKAC